MEEIVYCPRCDKTDMKVTAGMPGDNEGGATGTLNQVKATARGAIFGVFGSILFSGLKAAKRHMDDEYGEYIPLYYHCQSCGHTFMSFETNVEELRRANKNVISGLLLTIIFGFLSYLCISSISVDDDMKVLFIISTIVFAVTAVSGIVNVVKSWKCASALRVQLRELKQCDKRHYEYDD